MFVIILCPGTARPNRQSPSTQVGRVTPQHGRQTIRPKVLPETGPEFPKKQAYSSIRIHASQKPSQFFLESNPMFPEAHAQFPQKPARRSPRNQSKAALETNSKFPRSRPKGPPEPNPTFPQKPIHKWVPGAMLCFALLFRLGSLPTVCFDANNVVVKTTS